MITVYVTGSKRGKVGAVSPSSEPRFKTQYRNVSGIFHS